MFRWRSASLQGLDRRLWILFGGRIISATGFSIVMPFLSIFLYEEMGVPMTVVGLIFLGSAVAGAVGQMVGGELSDRLGRRPVMWVSMGSRGLIFVLLGLSIASLVDLRAIAGLLMVSSFMGSLFEPASNAMVADVVAPGRRMEAYSLLRVGANIGWVLGPLIGGLLAMFSYPSLFFLTAITCTVVAVAIFFKVADPPHQANLVRFRPRDIVRVASNKVFLLFCLASLPLAIVLGQMSSTFALFSEHDVGITVAEVGYLYAMNGAIVVFLQFPMARYLNQFRMSHVLAAGALMYAGGYFIVGWASDIWILAVSMIVTTLGENTTSPASTNFVANISPENERGRYMGVSGIFHSFGWSVGPLFGGLLYDSLHTAPVLLWGGIAAAALLSAIMYVYLGRLTSEVVDRVSGEPARAKS